MSRNRIVMMGASAFLMTVFLLAASITTTMDASGSIHLNYFWLVAALVSSLVFMYTFGKS
ncbi:hypothetical protein [Gluconobacter wancherniae]|uniref:Uncharacterized protein n=1 Tax=Gluconobacter wancherniae NBRC 103581 TaxID=656744 RepID=A0A511AY41_9PROT|nr:hypothetical protein [Gluconobacter wancherniae]MBF0853286.1 hypothetical protein [Gluconobacter wancherniae]MBS1061453.1 hypothetical protein [Gluconobacter wancherniae]MBS1088088.1 hypothetical protein [Gluconobacter wancherniae]MBS1093781.1 hypothetical protein [Gluconobacter wancherniae]GBD55983.1 hypothetical protein NBRC103581_00556 [Gluconobacter wancherniae NBRC 103581]